MRIRLALFAALVATPALVAASSALAADPDAPVATASSTSAPAASAPMSTAEQIDDFIRTSPMPDVRRDDAVGGIVTGEDDRKPHGEVSVGVGTGGYRSVYGRTDIPVGKNGRLSLAFADSRNDFRGGYGYGYGYNAVGVGLALGGPDRQRCDLEAMTPARPLDTMGGPHGRCVRPLSGW